MDLGNVSAIDWRSCLHAKVYFMKDVSSTFILQVTAQGKLKPVFHLLRFALTWKFFVVLGSINV